MERGGAASDRVDSKLHAAPAADDRPQILPQAPENIEFELGVAQDPLAPPRRGEGRGEGLGRLAAVAARPAPHPNLLPVNGDKGLLPAGDEGRQIPPQAIDILDSAPAIRTPTDEAPPPEQPDEDVCIPAAWGEARRSG